MMQFASQAQAPGNGDAARYANVLLGALGVAHRVTAGSESSARAWCRSGLWGLTGPPAHGGGWMCPAGLASAADGVLLALRALNTPEDPPVIRGALLLAERARLLGLRRNGRISANGSCQLMEAVDGRVAINLARPSDWDLVSLLIEQACPVGDWEIVRQAVAGARTSELAALARELGLPLAVDGRLHAVPVLPPLVWKTARASPTRRPRVVELASLWAGPLAGALLASQGAQVLKIESPSRPDGARQGHPAFFDLLNENKRMLTFEFRDPAQAAQLDALLETADIVIEGSRPRALEQIGIDRHRHVARGAIWVSITAHEDPHRVGFGDDAAVEAGLSTLMDDAWGEPVFVGDAIADPLTGLHAALAALATWKAGDSRWIPLSLSGTTAFAMAHAARAARDELYAWQKAAEADPQRLSPLRVAGRRARHAGADNGTLQALLRHDE